MLLVHNEESEPTLTSNMRLLIEFSTNMLNLMNEQNKLVPELGTPTTECFIKIDSFWFLKFGCYKCQRDQAFPTGSRSDSM